LKDATFESLGEAQHVDGAVDRCLGGLYWVVLIVNRRCRAGEVIDLVDLDKQWKGDVMAHEFEARI
jgi:hypothetical protein